MELKPLVTTVVLFPLFLLLGCSDSSGPGKDTEFAEKFVGTWLNEDEATRTITRMVIRIEAGTIKVHSWGKCHPNDCDWGENSTSVSDALDNQLSLQWDFCFAIETQTIHYLDDGRLRLDGHTHFIDDSGRSDSDYVCHFLKA
jgi:hypothetical protein